MQVMIHIVQPLCQTWKIRVGKMIFAVMDWWEVNVFLQLTLKKISKKYKLSVKRYISLLIEYHNISYKVCLLLIIMGMFVINYNGYLYTKVVSCLATANMKYKMRSEVKLIHVLF